MEGRRWRQQQYGWLQFVGSQRTNRASNLTSEIDVERAEFSDSKPLEAVGFGSEDFCRAQRTGSTKISCERQERQPRSHLYASDFSLRDGRHIATREIEGLEPLEMARLMVGRDMSKLYPDKPATASDQNIGSVHLTLRAAPGGSRPRSCRRARGPTPRAPGRSA